jgi:hypothetical protein
LFKKSINFLKSKKLVCLKLEKFSIAERISGLFFIALILSCEKLILSKNKTLFFSTRFSLRIIFSLFNTFTCSTDDSVNLIKSQALQVCRNFKTSAF